MCKRFFHATAGITVTHNRVWIIVNGGFDQHSKESNANFFVTGANVTVLVELGIIMLNKSIVSFQ